MIERTLCHRRDTDAVFLLEERNDSISSTSIDCDEFSPETRNALRKMKKTFRFRFFTCVNVCMFLHIGFLMKAFTAMRTSVGTRVRVDEQMRRQSGRTFERFAAQLTLKGFFLAVRRPMLSQCELLREILTGGIQSVVTSTKVHF